MNENYEAYAVAIIIVFGACVLGGLMAAAIAFGERDAFLFALGASAAAWIAGYAMFFDRARAFLTFMSISIIMAIVATVLVAK